MATLPTSDGKPDGLVMAIAISVLLVRGAIASFACHRARREFDGSRCAPLKPRCRVPRGRG